MVHRQGLVVGPPGEEINIPALRDRREALDAGRAGIFKLVGTDSSRLIAAEAQLEVIEAQIREVDVELAAAAQQHPLADLIGIEDVRAWWEQRTLGRKRAIVDMLMTVAIKPVGYGRRPRGPEEFLATLEIIPRMSGAGSAEHDCD